MSTKYPQGELQTKFGKVRFAWTQADHVYLGTDAGVFSITVRGVEYNVNAHLHLIDGTWQRKERFHEPYVSRLASDKNYNKAVSQSAREAIYNELVAIWSAYAAGNAASGTEAERHHLSGQLDNIDGEINEMERNLTAKRAERITLLAALNKVGGHV